MANAEKLEPIVSIVMPAYNAAKTLPGLIEEVPLRFRKDLILVDDCSSDDTVRVAKNLNIPVWMHQENLGYGGNQKTCYRLALLRGADIIIMLHPDGQYDPKYIPDLLSPIISGQADVVFGTRMKPKINALRGKMPLWKFLANVSLTNFANFTTGLSLTDWHCGLRAYRAGVLKIIDFENNSNNYDFDVQMTLGVSGKGFRILEIPIQARYFRDASSINFHRSVIYGINFLRHVWGFKGFK